LVKYKNEKGIGRIERVVLELGDEVKIEISFYMKG